MGSFASTTKRNIERPPFSGRSPSAGSREPALRVTSGPAAGSAVQAMAEASSLNPSVQSQLQLARSLNGGPRASALMRAAEALRAREAHAQTMLPRGRRGLASEPVQRRQFQDEEETAQAKCVETAEARHSLDEEEIAQGKFAIVQREEGTDDEDYPMQAKLDPVQRLSGSSAESIQRAPSTPGPQNRTGLPSDLKTGIENLSGKSLNDVKVHYNSTQPAQLNALAYTQGKDIHVGPGQQKHLAHEAWHVVQQAEGRVRPTMQMHGTAVNDDSSLEREADVMGARALVGQTTVQRARNNGTTSISGRIIQRRWNATDIENVITWSEPMAGLRWFFNEESRLMWYVVVSPEEVPKGNEKQVAENEGLKNAKEHGAWLKMGWGLTETRGGELEGNPAKLWEERGKDWVTKGEGRYKNMLEGSTVSDEEQYARDWFFENYYATTPGEKGRIESQYKYPPSDIGKDYSGTYKNIHDVESGTMTAEPNHALRYRDKFEGEYFYNPKTGKPEKISNSEILFQQWKKASGRKAAPLKKLIRAHVSGDGWKMVRGILLGTGQKQSDGPVYYKGSEGFFALLTVPNVTGAVYLVKDHGKELGIKGIAAIKVLSNLSLEIYFE